jgi:hypothetical protein
VAERLSKERPTSSENPQSIEFLLGVPRHQNNFDAGTACFNLLCELQSVHPLPGGLPGLYLERCRREEKIGQQKVDWAGVLATDEGILWVLGFEHGESFTFQVSS